MKDFGGCAGALAISALWLTGLSCWIYSIVITAKDENITMLIINLLLPPVGIVYGLFAWLF